MSPFLNVVYSMLHYSLRKPFAFSRHTFCHTGIIVGDVASHFLHSGEVSSAGSFIVIYLKGKPVISSTDSRGHLLTTSCEHLQEITVLGLIKAAIQSI